MGNRVYEVELRCVVTLVVDDGVIKQVDDEWRSMFYDFRDPEDVIKHLAYNMVANNLELPEIEGFGNLHSQLAVQLNPDWDIETVEEIKSGDKRRRRALVQAARVQQAARAFLETAKKVAKAAAGRGRQRPRARRGGGH